MPVGYPSGTGTNWRMADQEVPAPDALEQARPVEPAPSVLEPSLEAEVPEADALEQAREEPVDEYDGLR